MARLSKMSPGAFTFDQRVKVEVTPARFHVFDSTRQLDVARLKRAAQARFEVGYFESECCRRVLHAVVKRGQVVKLELEPCKGATPAPREMRPIVEKVARMLAARKKRGTTPLPMPVDKFLSNAAGLTINVWICFRICCFGYCIFCCFDWMSRIGFWWHCQLDKIGGP